LPNLNQLNRCAREIFDAVLASVDPRQAVKQAIARDGPMVEVCGERFDASSTSVFAIALGKAAAAMAHGLEDALGQSLTRGVISAPPFAEPLSQQWEIYEGGHPLPNEASVDAAEAAFNLLDWANDVSGVVIYLVSGGGSAMMEWPAGPGISLDDLRRTNELLVGCGARINEINAVRRAFSALKGGRLAQRAPLARSVTLIVSDTNRGDEGSVASGPTLPATDTTDPLDVINRYRLALPKSVLQSLALKSMSSLTSPYQVLLGNWTALEAAEQKARELGFAPIIAHHISEQPIQDGCDLLLASSEHTNCLISGGEFSCPVRGNGIGGRNLETALRCAMNLADRNGLVLSAGTDGIDGNSPAAGAIADETTIARARSLGLNPTEFLARSDSYTFFEKLTDLIVTGPTGTNVRDLRLVLKTKRTVTSP
jgi:glycerate 2-kinase